MGRADVTFTTNPKKRAVGDKGQKDGSCTINQLPIYEY